MKAVIDLMPLADGADNAHTNLQHDRHFEGERGLMAAVLIDALGIFYKTQTARDHRRILEFREVYTWIYGVYGDSPFSFENVCGALGIDANALRDNLKRGRRMQRQRERYFKHIVAPPRSHERATRTEPKGGARLAASQAIEHASGRAVDRERRGREALKKTG